VSRSETEGSSLRSRDVPPRHHGDLRRDEAKSERAGDELWHQLGFNSPDLIIAARHYGLVVVTRNLRHFDNSGVRLLDPYQRIN